MRPPPGFRAAATHRLPAPAHEARRLQGLLLAHGPVTTDELGEQLVAAAFGGTLMERGNKDFDIQCRRYGRVEVRTRILGTDGWLPRITLRRPPDGAYDHLAAVRLEQDRSFWRALILPTAALAPLYARYKQAKGIAHIPWEAAAAESAAEDITARLRGMLDGGGKVGH